MHPSYVPISEDALRSLYVDQQLAAAEIAGRLRCGPTTILRRLRRYGIPIRQTGPRVRLGRWGPSSWSSELAYAIGLIATDGNLSSDGRHMSFVSKDIELLETLRRCLNLHTSIAPAFNGRGRPHYRIQWGDRDLYDWLLAIGLTRAKSLTLGALAVPDWYFMDFLRGCIDGDGSVLAYIDRYHAAKNPRYVYQRLYVSLVSASKPFLDWIRERAQALEGVGGVVEMKRGAGRRPIWILRYAKRESMQLLPRLYYGTNVPCLSRKRAAAEQFLSAQSAEYAGGVPACRNWQTIWTQNPVPARA